MHTIGPQRNLSSVTTRGPSPAIWEDCPWLELVEGRGPAVGFAEMQDFIKGGLITAPTTEAALVGLDLSGFSSTASQITYGNAVYTTSVSDAGTLVLAETTSGEGTGIRSAATPYRMSAGFGRLWWETRLKLNNVATTEITLFAGFLEDTALTVNVPLLLGSTHELADKNVVCFHKPTANTTTLNATYKSNGNAAVVTNTGIGTLAASTYVKLGMTFNQKYDNKVRFYINNQLQTSTTYGEGKTVPDNTGTDFPADVALGWAIMMGVGAGANDDTVTIDWVRGAQELLG